MLRLACRHRLGRLDLDVDFQLAATGISGLFGPSGSGKTTLLRIIAGLERPVYGDVMFREVVWQQQSSHTFLPAHQRPVGFVFQNARLFSHLDVTGNLDYGHKRRRGAIRRDDVIDALDLGPLLARRTAALSGGEQQRVAIGRALLSQPELLLLDEPVSALDVPRRREVLGYLQRLPDQFGIPMIYVSHAVEEIAQLATQVIVLSDGHVDRTGTVTGVFGDGALTAGAGSGTVLRAQIVSHDETYRHSLADTGGQTLIIPGVERAPGTMVQLFVHARDVSIATVQPVGISIRNILKARIVDLRDEPDTPWVAVSLALADGQLLAHLTRHAVADLDLRPGQSVYALVKGVTLY